MKIAVQIPAGADVREYVAVAAQLEAAGVDCIWVGEATGWDAVASAATLLAATRTMRIGTGVLNVYSRSAAAIAMAAASLDQLGTGRVLCGLGSSGPQVIDGLHGLAFQRGLTRMREYTEVCRQLWRGEPAAYRGMTVHIPVRQTRAIGIDVRPSAGAVPIWWAGLGDAVVSAAAASADGWLPYLFMPERIEQTWGEALAVGLTQRPTELGPLQIAADVIVAIDDRQDRLEWALAAHRKALAFHIGAMGPPGRNFYNKLVKRYGFVDAAAEIEQLYVRGERARAVRIVPDELVFGTALIGSSREVAARLAAYSAAGVTMLNLQAGPQQLVEQVGRLADVLRPSAA